MQISALSVEPKRLFSTVDNKIDPYELMYDANIILQEKLNELPETYFDAHMSKSEGIEDPSGEEGFNTFFAEKEYKDCGYYNTGG